MSVKPVWTIIPLILIGFIGVQNVDAQCINELCITSTNVTKKFYENTEPYPIKHMKIFQHDDRGNQIARTEFDKNNNITSWELKTFDEKNNPSEIKKYERYRESLSYEKYHYAFGNNLAVKTALNSDGNIIGKFVYLLNDDGKTIKWQNMDLNGGNPIHTEFYDYDKKGKKIGFREFFKEMPGFSEKREYDEDGYLIKFTTYQQYEKSGNNVTYEYEDEDLISEKFGVSGDYFQSQKQFWYDENDNLVVEKKSTGSGKVISFTLFVYDKDSNLIEKKIMDGNGVIKKWDQTVHTADGKIVDSMIFYKNGSGKIKKWDRFVYEGEHLSQVIVFDVPKTGIEP